MGEKISIVVPCYNEENVLPAFFQEIRKVIARMPDLDFEFMLIDDGSSDGTLDVIKAYARQNEIVKYISFSRNFGKEAAIYAGLRNASGNYVVIMDADLQDPPALLPEMYRHVSGGEYDSVATRRVTRQGEPRMRSFFARQFYKIMNRLSSVDMVDGARDYRIMNRKFVNALLEMGEYNRFSKGLFGWVGYRTKWLEYKNIERIAGETKWSFWSLVRYSIEGIIAFSTAPLVVSAVFGVIMSGLSMVSLIAIVVRKMMFGDPVMGWASIISVILLIGGLLLVTLGIIGQYLAKTYLEVKHRPIYICGETNLPDSDGAIPCK